MTTNIRDSHTVYNYMICNPIQPSCVKRCGPQEGNCEKKCKILDGGKEMANGKLMAKI